MSTSVNKRVFRLNDDVLLKFQNNSISSFSLIHDAVGMTGNNYQYISKKNIDNIVWNSGTYKHRINKTYSMVDPLYVPEDDKYEDIMSTNISVCIGRNVDWSKHSGILLVIRDTVNNKILFSELLRFGDFKTQEPELINGTMWVENYPISIPASTSILAAECVFVDAEDVNHNGLITNYPIVLNPLIDIKPLPDALQVTIELDNRHFVKVSIVNDDNQKTIEQTILDYFEVSMANIIVNHYIYYGKKNGIYQCVVARNGNDQYLPVSLGLDLTPFMEPNSPNSDIHIFVETEISVDSKLIKRDTELFVNGMDIIPPAIWDSIELSNVKYPVTVEEVTKIEQTVVEAKMKTEIIGIPQIVIAEVINTDDYVIELPLNNKSFTNERLVDDCYMEIKYHNGTYLKNLKNKRDSNGKFYFNLENVLPNVLAEDVKPYTFEIKTNDGLKIVSGFIKNKENES